MQGVHGVCLLVCVSVLLSMCECQEGKRLRDAAGAKLDANYQKYRTEARQRNYEEVREREGRGWRGGQRGQGRRCTLDISTPVYMCVCVCCRLSVCTQAVRVRTGATTADLDSMVYEWIKEQENRPPWGGRGHGGKRAGRWLPTFYIWCHGSDTHTTGTISCATWMID